MKQRGVFLIGVFLTGIYYFLFPRGSGVELTFVPSALHARGAGPAGEPPDAAEHRAHFSNLGGDEFSALPNAASRTASGALSLIRNGYRYHYEEGSGLLSKIHPADGRILWSRAFISPLTVLDGQQNITLAGFLNGQILAIDDGGEVQLQFRPGGSRVEAIYGGVLSRDGERIALISGLDPQRFILLEKRRNAFRPAAHHNTGTNFRRPTSIGFIRDDTVVIYEADSHVAAVDVNNFHRSRLSITGELAAWVDLADKDAVALLGREGGGVNLHILTHDDRILFAGPLPSDMNGLRGDRGSLLISGDSGMAVMEMIFQ